jgi:hemolysin III
LLRGWSHGLAAAGALGWLGVLCWRAWGDWPRLGSLVIYGLSLVSLFGVSALYHLGDWQGRAYRRLRAMDHANIFLLIAGTYTPLCFNLLIGWVRPAVLGLIWGLAALPVSANEGPQVRSLRTTT